MASDLIEQYYNAGTSLNDAVKTLRTNVRFASVDQEIKTILITSVIQDDGKSTISVFLGISMAESGQRTLLVECDCRRPMLQNYLKIRPERTIADVISRRCTAMEAVVPTRVKRLDMLSSTVLASPVEVLSSKRFADMLDELKQNYDIIILDTPPLGAFIEAAILAANADGTLLVLQPGSTDVKMAQEVMAQLEKAKARVLGAVLNNVEMASSSYYYADYYYRDGKRKKTKGKKHRRSSASAQSEGAVKPAN